MKLYTEKEVKKAILIYHSGLSLQYALSKLTPIELPSDEEISEVAMVVYGFNARDIKDVLEYKAFKRGARLILNKIQGGNK